MDNYTITVTGPTMQELTSLGPTASTTVVYNEMYTVNVRASNCVGSSGSATANIFEGKDHVLKGWVCLSTSTSLLVYWLTHSNWHGICVHFTWSYIYHELEKPCIPTIHVHV